MIRALVLWFAFIVPFFSMAQLKTAPTEQIYSVNLQLEPIAVALAVGGGIYGYSRLGPSGRVNEEDLIHLNQVAVNPFDRHVFGNSQEGFAKAKSASDVLLLGSTLAPGLLFIDKSIRSQWKEVLVLYFESQALNSGIYQLSAFTIDRARPLSYNQNLSVEERISNGTKNSFFSGHTSSAAVASFFMAKVIADIHHLSFTQQLITYSLAAAPPIFMGLLRIKAGKHFRTDVIVGSLVGALTGVLVPALHKGNRKLKMMPSINSNMRGLMLTYNIK